MRTSCRACDGILPLFFSPTFPGAYKCCRRRGSRCYSGARRRNSQGQAARVRQPRSGSKNPQTTPGISSTTSPTYIESTSTDIRSVRIMVGASFCPSNVVRSFFALSICFNIFRVSAAGSLSSSPIFPLPPLLVFPFCPSLLVQRAGFTSAKNSNP